MTRPGSSMRVVVGGGDEGVAAVLRLPGIGVHGLANDRRSVE